jgi:hypothetical protein
MRNELEFLTAKLGDESKRSWGIILYGDSN